MIKLTKLNGKEMLVNTDQIEYIESIPESKIVMMNGEYLLATESMDEIIERVAAFKQKCFIQEEELIRKNFLSTLRDVERERER